MLFSNTTVYYTVEIHCFKKRAPFLFLL